MQNRYKTYYKRFPIIEISISQRIREKCITKILSSNTALNTGNNYNNKCLLSTKIGILDSFLKNHVTLKTGGMAAENSAFL